MTLATLIVGAAFVISAGAQDQARKLKSQVPPTYPELARKMNVTGTVKIQITIAPNGNVKSAKPIGGHPLLVDSALDAAKKRKYEPASDDSTEVVEFHFDNNN